MSKLNEIKAKVVECVPSIMELDFGCEFLLVEHGGEQKICGTYVDEVDGVEEIISVDYMHWNGMFRKLPVKDIYKVLGRPIELADVLRTLGQLSDHPTILSTSGEIGKVKDVWGQGFHNCPKWNLSESLENQGEETIDFIHRLLFKE